MIASSLLILGIACTVGHVIADMWRLREHIRHPRDWFSAASAVLLVGHVILTGELASWAHAVVK